MKYLILSLIFSFALNASAQKGRELIDSTRKEMADDIDLFNRKLVNTPLSKNIAELMAKADNPYKQYWVACALYDIDQNKSYRMISLAWEQDKSNPWFSLEYAIALHRLGRYERAISAYRVYSREFPKDKRIYTWLSECYLQMGDYPEALKMWKKSDRSLSGYAICTVHKEIDQLEMRMEMLDNINQQMTEYIYELIYMDLNWESNLCKNEPRLDFLEFDLNFIKERYGDTSRYYQTVNAYAEIKQLFEKSHSEQKNEIREAFIKHKLIIDGNPFPENGGICADLVKIALLIDPAAADRLLARRAELESLLHEKKDVEFLYCIAYLEKRVSGWSSNEVNLFGWQKAHDIRFASDYFVKLNNKITPDNAELQQAIQDFPESSFLRLLKIELLEKEGRQIPQELIIETIKLEYNRLTIINSHPKLQLDDLYELLEKSLKKK